jgi:hypothetical protein
MLSHRFTENRYTCGWCERYGRADSLMEKRDLNRVTNAMDLPELIDPPRPMKRQFRAGLRSRKRDFATITGIRSPYWSDWAVRTLASWRNRCQRPETLWDLAFAKRFFHPWDPRISGL